MKGRDGQSLEKSFRRKFAMIDKGLDAAAANEQEIEKLKEELEVYKNRKSNPQIIFEDGSSILKLKKPTPKDLEVEIENYLEKEKLKYPHSIPSDTDNYLETALRTIWEGKYNEQREEYFVEYKEYIRFIIQNEILSAQTGDMNIFTGTMYLVSYFAHYFSLSPWEAMAKMDVAS